MNQTTKNDQISEEKYIAENRRDWNNKQTKAIIPTRIQKDPLWKPL